MICPICTAALALLVAALTAQAEVNELAHYNSKPGAKEKGMLLVFNPTPETVTKTLDIPIYYTGLTDTARIREQEGTGKTYKLDRQFNVKLPVNIAANGYTWLIVE